MTISFDISLFTELTEKYPDWASFQRWLESEEGGFLRIVDGGEEGRCIIRYDKASSLLNVPHVRWFRSVIWDKEAHCPISVAPPRSSDSGEVGEAIEATDLVWEEYMDGVMIQCYWAVGDSEIEIATRSRRDASGTFYSRKAFRTLFLEANGGVPEMEKPCEERGEYAVYYSYVIQHPEHRMVTPILAPRAHIIQKGVIYRDRRVTIQDCFPALSYEITADLSQQDTYESRMAWVKSVIGSRSWTFRGLVAKDRTGQRWRFPSEKYKAIYSLRGNEPTVYERYARIFTQNLSGTYLEYYPEDTTLFSLCSMFIQHIIHRFDHIYRAVFIHKQATFADVSKMFHPHLYALHGIYLNKLRPSKLCMNPQEIRLYLTQLPPPRIAFLIRKQQDEYHSQVIQEP